MERSRWGCLQRRARLLGRVQLLWQRIEYDTVPMALEELLERLIECVDTLEPPTLQRCVVRARLQLHILRLQLLVHCVHVPLRRLAKRGTRSGGDRAPRAARSRRRGALHDALRGALCGGGGGAGCCARLGDGPTKNIPTAMPRGVSKRLNRYGVCAATRATCHAHPSSVAAAIGACLRARCAHATRAPGHRSSSPTVAGAHCPNPTAAGAGAHPCGTGHATAATAKDRTQQPAASLILALTALYINDCIPGSCALHAASSAAYSLSDPFLLSSA